MMIDRVTGAKDGKSYDFYRITAAALDEKGNPLAVGQITSNEPLEPGLYEMAVEVSSFQGKLVAKVKPTGSKISGKAGSLNTQN